MKILFLQLARYGDIYQTWPTINAVKRINPQAEIHLLVREKFYAATEGLTSVAKVHTLPTRDLLSSLFHGRPNVEPCFKKLTHFIDDLQSENFDRIINLSFSPSSSFLTELLSPPGTVTLGYSRSTDGFLAIPDDASAYFYAQVGTDRTNRIHITDLFALIAGAELVDQDFIAPMSASLPQKLKCPYVVAQLGASDFKKTCSSAAWASIVKQIVEKSGYNVVLVGSSNEAPLAESISDPQVINMIGQTELPQLFSILNSAEGLICGDSVTQHMASLCATKTFNLSFSNVRFWETGPRAKGSRVMCYHKPADVIESHVANEFLKMLNNETPSLPNVHIKNETMGVLYTVPTTEDEDFIWELTRALYMGQAFPLSHHKTVTMAFQRLSELASLGLEQIEYFKNPNQRQMAADILDHIDLLMNQVAQFEKLVSPLVRWFQTEKLRIAPGNMDQILSDTQNIFSKLLKISQLYDVNMRMQENYNREELVWKP